MRKMERMFIFSLPPPPPPHTPLEENLRENRLEEWKWGEREGEGKMRREREGGRKTEITVWNNAFERRETER